MRILGEFCSAACCCRRGRCWRTTTRPSCAALKARLKQLEQRMETQAKKEEALAARQKRNAERADDGESAGAVRSLRVGQALLQGRQPSPSAAGSISPASIAAATSPPIRARSSTSSRSRRARTTTPARSRFTARQTRFSVLAEANATSRHVHVAGYGELDFEGAAQTANSVATNSFNPRLRQASVEIDRTDLGLHVLAGQSWSSEHAEQGGHRSARRRYAGRDRFRTGAGLPRCTATGRPGLAGHRPRVQARGLGRESAVVLLRRQQRRWSARPRSASRACSIRTSWSISPARAAASSTT